MSMESQVARQFGATIRLERGNSTDRQLFIIRFRLPGDPVPGFVRAKGGRIVLGGRAWMLAEIAYSQAMSLQRAPGIISVRGVSIDPKRLELFRRAVEGARPPQNVPG